MEERKFPPPPPRPPINQAAQAEQTERQEVPAQGDAAHKKANLRLIFLIVGAIVSFIGATVCGYFLFG